MLLFALASTALATTATADLAPHPMRPAGGAPGLYASYDWPKPKNPKTPLTSPDMETDHTWVTIPR